MPFLGFFCYSLISALFIFCSFHKIPACHSHSPLPAASNHSHLSFLSSACRSIQEKVIIQHVIWMLICSILFSSPPLPLLLQVFQRLRLSNAHESTALRELLRWRRAQCEGRGDWKHPQPQSPPLPPTLLWTNRKASPWWRVCDADTCMGYEVHLSPALQTNWLFFLFLIFPFFFFFYVDQVTSTPRGEVKAPGPNAWASSLGWRSCLASLTATVEDFLIFSFVMEDFINRQKKILRSLYI